ncbi:hypothetical protein MKW98_005399 [Papaver atlanticum]|uniref:Magnesium transporter n=1 Tax=Papaver atlanticum TaxID=357466 RepID=A0AAD4X531_9MAGN|nr:hypothetical protein MKW98_005399 [Papaver atlanticum]
MGDTRTLRSRYYSSQVQPLDQKEILDTKTWWVYDSVGRAQKLDLEAEYQILLDTPSITLLGCEKCILVNIEHLKAILPTEEVYVLDSSDLSLPPFLEEMSRQLSRRQDKSQEADEKEWSDDTEEVEEGKMDELIRFEFVALDVCLQAAWTCLDKETALLETEVALPESRPTMSFEQLCQIQTRVIRIRCLVNKVKEDLAYLLSNDRHMAEMEMDLRRVDSGLMTKLESLLQERLVQFNWTSRKLSRIMEDVDRMETNLKIKLDVKKLHSSQIQLVMGILGTSLTVVAAVANIFV